MAVVMPAQDYRSSAATIPAATPPTASTLPAAPVLAVELPPAALAVLVMLMPVELPAAEEEVVVAAAWTSLGDRVPQFLHAWEPAFALRHWAKVASQMKVGRVP